MPDGVEATPKHSIWWSVILIVVLFLIALFAALQHVTLGWLAAFPDRAPDRDTLSTKAWIYLAVSALSLIASAVMLNRLVRRENRHYRASRSAARQQVKDPD
jgi:membrane protein implicated in regulation of membrane protease activity